jgi:hypothetical protein
MSHEIVRFSSLPDNIVISTTGVTFTGDLDYDEWARLMGTMQRLYTSFQFGIGDVLNYGEKHHGEKYSQALDSTNAAYQSLCNYSWVANAIPIENRVEGLSWTHHRAAASLPVDHQRRVLNEAFAKQLTVAELTKLIKGEPDVIPERLPTVTVPSGMTVEEAIERLQCPVENPTVIFQRCPECKHGFE